MITFDQVLLNLIDILSFEEVSGLTPLAINRDLNGRVRLIVDEKFQSDPTAKATLYTLATAMRDRLGKHAYPTERAVLFEPNISDFLEKQPKFALDADFSLPSVKRGGMPGVFVLDRLASEGSWASIAPVSNNSPRVIFYSIKGGVGRSTALAATAWALARQGRAVMVLDLDLESPGLSSFLLPNDRHPPYGIVDWLVEDLVDNADSVIDSMSASFVPSRVGGTGLVHIIPAHGFNPGDYISKLGRVWIPKQDAQHGREAWSHRLARLIAVLEGKFQPDIILIDSRSGIDETASAIVTDLGAAAVMLFALDDPQTWVGYDILFKHWLRADVAAVVRERLQVVAALVPEENPAAYTETLRARAWDVLRDRLYDAVPVAEDDAPVEAWSFDLSDESAPHSPVPIRWNRGMASLVARPQAEDPLDLAQVSATFGPLIDWIARMCSDDVTEGEE